MPVNNTQDMQICAYLPIFQVVVDRDDCSKELLEWGSRVGRCCMIVRYLTAILTIFAFPNTILLSKCVYDEACYMINNKCASPAHMSCKGLACVTALLSFVS